MPNHDEPSRVALHEAAHAVLLHDAGIAVRRVVLDADRGRAGGRVVAGLDALCAPASCALAGAAAEIEAGYPAPPSDRWASDFAAAERACRRDNVELSAELVRTRNLLWRRWPAVRAVRDALLRRRALDRNEITRLIETAVQNHSEAPCATALAR